MPKFVELKQEMKEKQVLDRQILKSIEAELKEMKRSVVTKIDLTPDEFKEKFPYLYRQLLLFILEKILDQEKNKKTVNKSFERIKKLINKLDMTSNAFFSNLLESFKELLTLIDWGKNDKGVDLSFDVDKDFDKMVADVRKTYNANQLIINAMDNEKIINYIDLERLLSHLVNSALSSEDTFEIFSLAVGFDIKYLQTHRDVFVPNMEYVEKFSAYFNIDGTPKLNYDIEGFKKILVQILTRYMFSYKAFSELGILSSDNNTISAVQIYGIVEDYSDLFEKNRGLTKDIASSKEHLEDTYVLKSPVDRRYLDELRRYYRNNVLVEIPEDIDAFIELLDRCEIDESEKRYILGLINEAKEVSQNKIVKYLNPNDKKTYEKALDILSGLHHTDGDYYVLIQLLDDLKAVGDILEETQDEEDKIYLDAEVSDLIIKIEEIISKYLDKEESENTVLFLLDENEVPYLKLDSDLLDGSFYKMVCNGIKKIRKDNQSNFRLVMTNDNISYKVYDILSSKLHLSFIEIDSGIYLLLGVDVVSRGYESMIKRAINHESAIQKLELLVKNEKTRNANLSEHEQYFSLFNPNDRDVTRKRTDNN